MSDFIILFNFNSEQHVRLSHSRSAENRTKYSIVHSLRLRANDMSNYKSDVTWFANYSDGDAITN